MRLWPRSRRAPAAEPCPGDAGVIADALGAAAADVLTVHARETRGAVVILHGDLRAEAARAVPALVDRFAPYGYTPFVQPNRGGVVVQAYPLAVVDERPRVRLSVTLFVLTVLSTLLAGSLFFVGSPVFDALRSLPFPGWLLSGTPFAVPLLVILGVHEFGHYLTARRYGAAVSLPYFIPAPPPFIFGTLGALIRMRSPVRDRNSLFDIAAAGPLAGFFVALPAFLLGLAWSQPMPASAETLGGFGHSLATRFLVWLRFGDLPDGVSLLTHPVADAAWVGLLVTALNLFPVGQLDGGRIAYALFGRRHYAVGVTTFVLLILLGLLTGAANWFVWAGLLFFFIGFHHTPPLDDVTPLSPGRRLVGLACLVLLVLLVPPVPIQF